MRAEKRASMGIQNGGPKTKKPANLVAGLRF
jgi:hypothetical protein